MPLDRVAHQATWLLSQAHIRAQGILRDAFSRAGVRGYHYRLMAALDQYGPLSQAELGRRTGIDRSDVVAALNELVDDDRVRREPDPGDRRRNVVRLTPTGRRKLVSLDAVLADVQDDVLEPLTAAERRQLVGLLERLGSQKPNA